MMNTTDIAALLAQCRTGTTLEKIRAMMALEELQAREAVPVILELIADEEIGVRNAAADALGTLGDRDVDRVAPALQTLLDDPESLVRSSAAESLGFLRYRPARPALERVLRCDEHATPRASAAEAIGLLGDPRALPAVRRQLDIEPRPGTRGDLIAAALRLGDDAAFDHLLDFVDLLGHEDDDEQLFHVQVQGALESLLTDDPPAIVRERADELDRSLAPFDEPLLRELLARLRGE